MYLTDQFEINQKKNEKDKREITLICHSCGRPFIIGLGEICWHYRVGNIIPTRCKKCKEKIKEKGEKV